MPTLNINSFYILKHCTDLFFSEDNTVKQTKWWYTPVRQSSSKMCSCTIWSINHFRNMTIRWPSWVIMHVVIFLHPPRWGRVKPPPPLGNDTPNFVGFLMICNGFKCKFVLLACLQPPNNFLYSPPNFKFLEITLHTRRRAFSNFPYSLEFILGTRTCPLAEDRRDALPRTVETEWQKPERYPGASPLSEPMIFPPIWGKTPPP